MWNKCTECKQEYKVNGVTYHGPTMFRSRHMYSMCFECWLKRNPTPVTSPRKR